MDPDEHRAQLAQYYAAVTLIDEQVGRLLDELANMACVENTLVVYTADHGHMNGHHGLYCKGNTTTPQNFLDESIGVPSLLAWPGVVQAGTTHECFVDHCDLHATLLDAAGAEPSAAAAARSPGRSFLPLLRGLPVDDWRRAQCCEYGNARMIRTPVAKLIRRWPGPNGAFPDEFYDLASDPRERVNRIDEPRCQPTIADLTRRLAAYYERHEDPARRGTAVADHPIHNPDEPWRRQRPA